MLALPLAAGLAASVVATSFLSGLFGMAGGMVLMALLLSMWPVGAAMALHGFAQTTSNGWRAWLWRTNIRWGIVARYGCGALVALGLLSVLRFVPDKAMALIGVGLTPVIGMLVPKRAALNAMRPAHALAAGLVCTGAQLLAGVAGPLLDTFFVRSGLPRRDNVATKAATQMIGHALKAVYFGTLPFATGESVIGLDAIAVAVSAALIGTTLARRPLDRMTDASFNAWSRAILALVSVGCLGQGIGLMAGSITP